jgi:hypothetical protein
LCDPPGTDRLEQTELIADRVWQARSQLELVIIEYVARFNTSRVHSALAASWHRRDPAARGGVGERAGVTFSGALRH